MNLKSKKSSELVYELQSLVKTERETTLRILHYLEEVDSRKLYLEQAYPSLFEWVRKVLGYSESATQRRIDAMRLLRVLPELESKIESGDISLSVASQAQSFFRREDQRRREEAVPLLKAQDKKEIVLSLVGSSSRECERRLAEMSPELTKPQEKARALPGGETLVQFVADEELMVMLERLQGLLGHQLPDHGQKTQALIKKIASMALRQLEPKKQASLAPAPVIAKDSGWIQEPKNRHIPLKVQRAVRLRDQDRCTYKDHQTGKICGSLYAIEFDHLRPYAMGGWHTFENITLRCRAHNQFTAEKRFGVFRDRKS